MGTDLILISFVKDVRMKEIIKAKHMTPEDLGGSRFKGPEKKKTDGYQEPEEGRKSVGGYEVPEGESFGGYEVPEEEQAA